MYSCIRIIHPFGYSNIGNYDNVSAKSRGHVEQYVLRRRYRRGLHNRDVSDQKVRYHFLVRAHFVSCPGCQHAGHHRCHQVSLHEKVRRFVHIYSTFILCP